MRTIYVAGASAEVDMVAGYVAKLREAGWEILFDWTVGVMAQRADGRTDRDLAPDMREDIATAEQDAVCRAHYFWLLVPSAPSVGCWIELGIAIQDGYGPHVIVSGDHGRTLFGSLCHEHHATHDEAIASLLAVPGGA